MVVVGVVVVVAVAVAVAVGVAVGVAVAVVVAVGGREMTITTPAQMREAAALLPCPFCGGEASAEGYQKWSKPVLNVTWDGGDPITEAYFCNCPTCCVSNITSGIGYRTRAEAIANWNRRALPVAEAAPVAVKVKPLEFEGRNGFWRAADGLGGFYEICEVNGGFHMTRITLGVGSAFVTYPTIDAAQAAANADHAARILSQIDAVSVAQVRAEALDALLADDEMCLRLAEGYDREDAAQRGEPSPHSDEEGYAEWASDRIACAKEGLRAIRALMEKPE